VLREFFGVRDLKSTYLDGRYDLSRLAESLAESHKPDMDRSAALEAMDCLDAYYKVGKPLFRAVGGSLSPPDTSPAVEYNH
jgi:hypothetical protein